MNRYQEFVDWAKERLSEGQSELAVAHTLQWMNTFYLWVFDHLSTTHLDEVLAVESWQVVRKAKEQLHVQVS